MIKPLNPLLFDFVWMLLQLCWPFCHHFYFSGNLLFFFPTIAVKSRHISVSATLILTICKQSFVSPPTFFLYLEGHVVSFEEYVLLNKDFKMSDMRTQSTF